MAKTDASDPRITTALERIKRIPSLGKAYSYKTALGDRAPEVVMTALIERIAQLRVEAARAAMAKDQLPLFD